MAGLVGVEATSPHTFGDDPHMCRVFKVVCITTSLCGQQVLSRGQDTASLWDWWAWTRSVLFALSLSMTRTL